METNQTFLGKRKNAPPTTEIVIQTSQQPTTTSSADSLEIMPIGAGNEVGRSCVILKYKGKVVMVLLWRKLIFSSIVVFIQHIRGYLRSLTLI
jgi:hypothetical protein